MIDIKMRVDSLWLLVYLIALVVALTFRGFCKAFVANILGDPTPKDFGFLSINPIDHVDAGSVLTASGMILVFSLFNMPTRVIYLTLLVIAIITGSQLSFTLPINTYNFKQPIKAGAILGLTGIASQFLLALMLLYGIRIVTLASFFTLALKGFLTTVLFICVFTSLCLAIVYSVPIPLPSLSCDGFSILRYIAPSVANFMEDNTGPTMFILFILLIWSPFFDNLVQGLTSTAIVILNTLVFI